MKRALLLLFLTAAANAQSVFDLDDWMDRVDERSQDLQRHIAARDAAAATASARELEDMYARMEAFFAKLGTGDDAVRWSREAREFAQRAQVDLAGKRFSEARRSALAIARGCRNCHYNYKPL